MMTLLLTGFLGLLLVKIIWSSLMSVTTHVFSSSHAVEGQPHHLTCHIVSGQYSFGNPYSWMKDGTVIPHSYSAKLNFTNVTVADDGDYQCAYNTTDGKDLSYSDVYEMVVEYAPRVEIKVSTSKDSALVKSGEKVVLTCHVIDAHLRVPDDGYTWTHLENDNNLKVFRNLNETSSLLTFPKVKSSERGWYHCTASYGNISPGLHGTAKIFLDVLYMDRIKIEGETEAVEGQDIVLSCTVHSNPPANITWLRNGKVIQDMTIHNNSLHIKVSHEDNGIPYQCQAANNHFPDLLNASTTLHVKYRPYKVSLVRTKKTCAGCSIALELYFDAEPAPTNISWSYHGKDLVSYDIRANATILHLPNLKEDDFGTYHVRVTNDVGSLKEQIDLVKEDPADNTWVKKAIIGAVVLSVVVGCVVFIIIRRPRLVNGAVKTIVAAKQALLP